MAPRIFTRMKHAWNAFTARDPTNASSIAWQDLGPSYSYRPDRTLHTRGNERSIINSIYNRIALDVAQVTIQHIKTDEDGRFEEVVHDSLNTCLTLRANLDQTSRAFIQDAVISMMDEGCVALAPIDVNIDDKTGEFSIESIRTGKITDWHPRHVKVNAYNDRTGRKQDLIMEKERVAIVENPFYTVMNQPNSVMQRLIRTLSVLDAVDSETAAGKMNLIIQLPYVVRSEHMKKTAEERRQAIEEQLGKSKYGVAYTDGTEHVLQLNRPIDNTLMSRVEYLTSMLYSQLGMTQGILDGTADEKTMQNYMTRMIEPILSAITDEMTWKFLSDKARNEDHELIMFFRDPFRLMPVSDVTEMADKMTRNEIMTSNELRQKIGLKPAKDPRADELRNSNLNTPADDVRIPVNGNDYPYSEEE